MTKKHNNPTLDLSEAKTQIRGTIKMNNYF